MRWLFFGVIFLVFGGAGFLLVRNGAFTPVEIRIEQQGPLILLSKAHMGPYHKILPTLEQVETWAKAAQVPCPRTFGEFLDDPNVVDMDRLKSNVGCELTSKPASFPEDFQLREIPARKYIVATYSGSPALGPYKVYGKADSFRRENRLEPDGSIIEMYKVEGNGVETTYLFPVK